MTSKEALQRIGEYSEAAITIRGTYFPPGKEPKEGERKIYLAIESMCQGNYLSVLVFFLFFYTETFKVRLQLLFKHPFNCPWTLYSLLFCCL